MTLRPVEASVFQKIPEELKAPMLQSGVFPVPDVMMKLWTLPNEIRTVVLIGGRGSMKTHTVSDYIARQASVNKKRCVILRDEKSRIKDSILSEILLRYDDLPYYTGVKKLETGLKDDKTGVDLVFTMGFKASDNSKTANMKGVSNIDIAVIEEAEDIRDVKKFNDFTDSLRKEGCLVIIILNTPDLGHWVLNRFFHTNITAPVPKWIKNQHKEDFEGFFDISPKESETVACIKTTFLDNPYLPESKIKEYNAYGDPESPTYDPHHFCTSIMGYASPGRKGQVLKKVKPISLKEYLALPYREFYGQDFGTASPAGLVGVKLHRNKCWCRQLNYMPMTTLDIAKLYCTLKFNIADEIVADSADPKSISKLKSGYKGHELNEEDFKTYPHLAIGWNVISAVKGTDSINYGIDTMTGMELYAVSESADLWNEILNYVYAVDKNGNYTNDPIDDFNHLIDPWRYVINRHRGKNRMGSQAG